MKNSELVFKNNDENLVTSSLIFAKEFERRHYHVLTSIRSCLATRFPFSQKKEAFKEKFYTPKHGMPQPIYEMTIAGFCILARNYNDPHSLSVKERFIEAFNNPNTAINDNTIAVENVSDIYLTNGSPTNEIELYFREIKELSKSNNLFPVNLDEVWPLVYSEKGKATRSLEENFIQDVDYRVFAQNGKNPQGGRPSNVYKLSVSCLEYFIVRKIRPVFEVYRKVFHKIIDNIIEPKAGDYAKASLSDTMTFIDNTARILNMNDSSKLAMIHKAANSFGVDTSILPDYTKSEDVMLCATDLLKQNGNPIKTRNFNKKLIEFGYLVEKEKITRTKKVKFKMLTEEGSYFGENYSYQGNANNIQVLFYEKKFPELLRVLKLTS